MRVLLRGGVVGAISNLYSLKDRVDKLVRPLETVSFNWYYCLEWAFEGAEYC